MTEFLSERAQYLLKVLIEKHILDGQPVGSKTLANDTVLALSPATIRNVLADLEEKGYITAPHTSAGRIPTARGYRFFVDSLLTIRPITPDTVMQCQQQLSSEQNIQELINTTSALLSGLTHMVGLVTLPRQEHLLISHIEFLPLSMRRILVILVFNDKEIQNRIIQVEQEYTREELLQAANFLNETFLGQDFTTVRQNILNAMRSDKERMNQLMQRAINLADKALKEEAEDDYVVAGQTNLIDVNAETDLNSLRRLFDTFTQKQTMLDLFERCFKAQGVQIFIGAESKHHELQDYSVITSTYSVEDQPVGVLGIIGPTRMPYDRIIPIVDITAKILTSTLNQ